MYELSTANLSERGFLLPETQKVVSPSFSWVPGMARFLPYLTEAGTDILRSVLDQLPLLDTSEVTDTEVRRSLMRDYHFLLIAYANALPKVDRIPAPIAVPSYELAQSFGVHPMLSYTSIVLCNLHLKESRPFTFEHVQPIRTFTRLQAESGFLVPHGLIEHELRRALCQARHICDDMHKGHAAAIIPRLQAVADAVGIAHRYFGYILEHCPPAAYLKIRPWMDGIKGVIFEGVAEWGNEPQSFIGPSGAQSPSLPLIDALLSIMHEKDPFSEHLRTYMLPEHLCFISEIEQMLSLRAFILSQQGNSALRDAYNAAVKSVWQFRKVHLAFTEHYLGGHDAHGTGGSMHRIFLQQYIDDTEAALI